MKPRLIPAFTISPLFKKGSNLTKNILTIAVAESVTSGHILVALFLSKENSLVFPNGTIVGFIHAAQCDCVFRKQFKCLLAVSRWYNSVIGTGIMGNVSLMPEKEFLKRYLYFCDLK